MSTWRYTPDLRAQLGTRFFTHDYEQLGMSLRELFQRAGWTIIDSASATGDLVLGPDTPLFLEYTAP